MCYSKEDLKQNALNKAKKEAEAKLPKIPERKNIVCGIMHLDFGETVDDLHPLDKDIYIKQEERLKKADEWYNKILTDIENMDASDDIKEMLKEAAHKRYRRM